MNQNTYSYAGMFTTALRWVAGWTYFSAFWRRLVLENKLNPEEAGYIGEKFNHFLPNALLIKPIIEYLVSNPDHLWWSMMSFTIIEGIVGLFFILGFYTRLMSVSVLGLAMGILLGSGWLGTTCLDEWQIGVLGVAAGFVIFFSGGGKFSVDEYLIRNQTTISKKRHFAIWAGGVLPLSEKKLSRIVLFGSLFILGLTLFTNQYFHGGLYGPLHNRSVKPHITITNAAITNSGTLEFTIFRDEGADVYGSFVIAINIKDKEGSNLIHLSQNELAKFDTAHISNYYIAKVKPGIHSMIVPLGAKAKLSIPLLNVANEAEIGSIELVDITGLKWVYIMNPE